MRTFTEALAAGEQPDVARLPLRLVAQLAVARKLDVEAATELIETLNMEDFYAGALEMVESPWGESGWTAVPLDGWVQGIWYRRDLFEETGLLAPTTFETILQAAEQFHDPPDRYGVALGTAPDQIYTQLSFEQFALAGGAHLMTLDGSDFAVCSPAFADALDFYTQLAIYAPPYPQDAEAANRLYLEGSAAMLIYSSALLDDLAKNPELAAQTGFVPIIEGPLGHQASFGDLSALAIFAGGQREAALEWADLLLSEGYFDLLSPNGVPVRRSAVSVWAERSPLAAYSSDLIVVTAEGFAALQRWDTFYGGIYPAVTTVTHKRLIPTTIWKVASGEMETWEAIQWLAEALTMPEQLGSTIHYAGYDAAPPLGSRSALCSGILLKKRLGHSNLKIAQAASEAALVKLAEKQIAEANAWLGSYFDGLNVPADIKRGFRRLLETDWSGTPRGILVLDKLIEFAEGDDISFSNIKGWGFTTMWFLQHEIYVSESLKGDFEAIASVLAHEGAHAAFHKMKHVDVYIEEIKVYVQIGKFSGGSFYVEMNNYMSYSSRSDLRSKLRVNGIDPDETLK